MFLSCRLVKEFCFFYMAFLGNWRIRLVSKASLIKHSYIILFFLFYYLIFFRFQQSGTTNNYLETTKSKSWMHFDLPLWVLELQWDKIKSISLHTDYPSLFYPQPPEKQRIRGIFCEKEMCRSTPCENSS